MEKLNHEDVLHALHQINELEAKLLALHDLVFELRTRLLEPFSDGADPSSQGSQAKGASD